MAQKNNFVSAFLFLEYGKEIPSQGKAGKLRYKGQIANEMTLWGYIQYVKDGHGILHGYENGYLDYIAREEANIPKVSADERWEREPIVMSSYGKLTKEDNWKEIRNEFINCFNMEGKLLWIPLISLKDYGVAESFNLFTDEDYSAVINDFLPKWFRRVHLNPENMNWVAAYHNNTVHPHIHFAFGEKVQTRTRGKFSESEMNDFRFLMVSSAKRRAMELGYIKADAELSKQLHLSMDDAKMLLLEGTIKSFEKSMNNIYNLKAASIIESYDNKIEKSIIELFSKLDKDVMGVGKLAYNSKNMAPFKKDIDEITKLILNHPDNKDDYTSLIDKWKELDAFSKGDQIENADSYQRSESEKLFSRIGNIILQQKKDYDSFRRQQNFIDEQNGKEFSHTTLRYKETRLYDIDFVGVKYEFKTNDDPKDILSKHPYFETIISFKDNILKDSFIDVAQALNDVTDFICVSIEDDNKLSIETKITDTYLAEHHPFWLKEDAEFRTSRLAFNFIRCAINNLQDGKINSKELKDLFHNLSSKTDLKEYQKMMSNYVYDNKEQPDNPYYYEKQYSSKYKSIPSHYNNQGHPLSSHLAIVSSVNSLIQGLKGLSYNSEVSKGIEAYYEEEVRRNQMQKEKDERMENYVKPI